MRLEMDLATLDYSYTACVSVMLVSVVVHVHVSGYETTVKWAHKNANESAGICKEMITPNENHARQSNCNESD